MAADRAASHLAWPPDEAGAVEPVCPGVAAPVLAEASAMLSCSSAESCEASCDDCGPCSNCARSAEKRSPPDASGVAPDWRARLSAVCALTVLATIALAAADATSCTLPCPPNAVAKPGPHPESLDLRFICAKARTLSCALTRHVLPPRQTVPPPGDILIPRQGGIRRKLRRFRGTRFANRGADQ